ncbi:hypothetical protein BD414DRAFT_518217 [Trametes punicea]|nr:hypothetical protein BD414DRAFT_518217 [Trametes punicea]
MPARTSNERNVVLKDYHGGVLAGFYQYGTVSWSAFFQWLSVLLNTAQAWVVVSGDRYASEQYFPTSAIMLPGHYTLLASDWSPLHVKLAPAHARRAQATPLRAKSSHLNLHHSRGTDRHCASGQELCWCMLQAAHTVSETHPRESGMGPAVGRARCTVGSLPNMLLLREDLHRAWAECEFGVDPDDGYRITAFVSGHDSIAGRVLRLDHISDPSTRPLDPLLRDHFSQGLLKHVKGRGERHWDFSRPLDLSDARLWGTDEGKERLEVELEHRLFLHRLKQGRADEVRSSVAPQ